MQNILRPALVLGTALLINVLSAQTLTENYIELTVTDTLSTKLKRISYSYTPQTAEMYSDATYDGSDD
ncbi:MAG TPA: hypothetical protein PL070_13400, partial [Flavobacteriales bacterium]|nr:hypothetical protein [Flavobacteriales bacterium]